jgi:hypothetical protein
MGGHDLSRHVYGLDPASKADYFGIVCHELIGDDEHSPPKLRAINQMTHTSFDKIYSYLVDDLFKRYYPDYIVVDYTNEKTFSDMLVSMYGKGRVELISFSNASKLQLKEDGLSILKQGYRFPDPSRLNDKGAAMLVTALVHQLKSEQLLETKTDKPTFDHPSGQHNDLAIAWELSVHGCLRFMMKKQLIGITPRDVEDMERAETPKSGIRCVDSDTGQDWRTFEDASPSHEAYYKPGR